MTLDDVTLAFRAALNTVWGESAANVCFFAVTDPPPNHGVLAALRYDTHVARSRGRVLLAHASNHMLTLAPVLLEKPDDIIQRFLLHEAIHVGRPRHDAGFKKIAEEVGAILTEQELEGVFKVERQLEKKRRFRAVYTTQDKEDALEFARSKKAGAGRYRIVY